MSGEPTNHVSRETPRAVSRETSSGTRGTDGAADPYGYSPMTTDDTPIGAAAQRASEVLHPGEIGRAHV